MNFNTYSEKGNNFIKELASELGDSSDTDRAYRILRAVFHTLREHIPQEESFQLISQLPMLLKAIYIDGWIPAKKKHISRKADHFVEEVMRNDWSTLSKDFTEMEDGTKAVKAVFKVLEGHVSKGEFKDIEVVLPKELKELIKTKIRYKAIKLKNIQVI